MTEEIRFAVLSAELTNQRGKDGDSGASQEEAGGDACNLAFERRRELIFWKFLGSDSVVHMGVWMKMVA